MTHHDQTHARDFWKHQPLPASGWNPEEASRRAARVRSRAMLAHLMVLFVALGCLAWAGYLISAADSVPKTVVALPWMLISLGAAVEWWKRRSTAANPTGTTSAYWRDQLLRDLRDCHRLAGWQGFAAVLGIMWLTIGSRVAADGADQAFAQRGLAEGLAIALLLPLVASALVHMGWRWHLRRVAAERQLELDYLELMTHASGDASTR
jgi:hypothetical protein